MCCPSNLMHVRAHITRKKAHWLSSTKQFSATESSRKCQFTIFAPRGLFPSRTAAPHTDPHMKHHATTSSYTRRSRVRREPGGGAALGTMNCFQFRPFLPWYVQPELFETFISEPRRKVKVGSSSPSPPKADPLGGPRQGCKHDLPAKFHD